MESTHYHIQKQIRIAHSAHECAIPCTSKVTRLDPQHSTPPRPTERTWRNTDRSLRVRDLKTFSNKTLSILILGKTYPTSGYNLAHISRHAKHLAGGYFAEKATKVISYFHHFSSRFYLT
jgi:hypothetical protein